MDSSGRISLVCTPAFAACTRRRWLLGWLALPASATAQRLKKQPDLPQAERELVERSNAFRRARGLPSVARQAALTAAAAQFAAFMARTNRFSHQADGRDPSQRAQAEGYDYCLVSENIATQSSSEGFGTSELAQRFVQGWIDSPGHRRNLLDAEAVDIGVAIANNPRDDRYVAVQMFGRPASLRLRFDISNRSTQDLHYQLGDKTYALPRGATRSHEQCAAQALSVTLPGQAQPARRLPIDGAHYRVEAAGRGWRLGGG